MTIDGRTPAPQLRGQPGIAREWIYLQLDEKYFVRDARWKLTDNGKLFDISDAPFQETTVPADTVEPNAIAARRRLQTVLGELRPPTK